MRELCLGPVDAAGEHGGVAEVGGVAEGGGLGEDASGGAVEFGEAGGADLLRLLAWLVQPGDGLRAEAQG
ncbi:hypothetical protein ADK82_20255 [Streptomyces sp. NRRL S-4]|nr:hypothetical protein ADK82_20255 [Streptomyces sp. NRRL S-4]